MENFSHDGDPPVAKDRLHIYMPRVSFLFFHVPLISWYESRIQQHWNTLKILLFFQFYMKCNFCINAQYRICKTIE